MRLFYSFFQKNMISKNMTVGEIVAKNVAFAEIFEKYGIDFCCGGDVSFAEICEKNNLDAEKIIAELQNLPEKQSADHDFENFDLGDLADYIVDVHHTFVRENIPRMDEYLGKICRVHGENHPELFEVLENYKAVREELLAHMPKEENVLFPYIHRLVDAEKNNIAPAKPPFGTVKNPIRMMEMEHDNAGDATKNIRNLTNNFTLPADACNSYRITFELLENFEKDLHVHIHLENNILFPKTIALEEKLWNA